METVTREVTARQLRSELASLVNEVAFGGGRVVLHRYGRAVAFLIGVDDFRRLRRLESAPGALDAEETLDELAARLIREGRQERAAAAAHAEAQAEAEARVGVAPDGRVTRTHEAAPDDPVARVDEAEPPPGAGAGAGTTGAAIVVETWPHAGFRV